jgi:hypothetical protein
MQSHHSPSQGDLDFLQRWFQDKNMGHFPLIGLDSDVWEGCPAPELLAINPCKGDDPFAALFLNRAMKWWHNWVGYRVKRPADEESQYFVYNDKDTLRIANIVVSVISSALLVGSIMTLYFVNNMLARLGIIAALTQLFSLTLVLVTNARKVEMFAATAAYVLLPLKLEFIIR